MNKPLDRLRHHVTGAIERGEAEPIVEQREVKSNRAWREECEMLRVRNARLEALIQELALIPANDFYRPGDYASGLVVEAWRKARAINSPIASFQQAGMQSTVRTEPWT